MDSCNTRRRSYGASLRSLYPQRPWMMNVGAAAAAGDGNKGLKGIVAGIYDSFRCFAVYSVIFLSKKFASISLRSYMICMRCRSYKICMTLVISELSYMIMMICMTWNPEWIYCDGILRGHHWRHWDLHHLPDWVCQDTAAVGWESRQEAVRRHHRLREKDSQRSRRARPLPRSVRPHLRLHTEIGSAVYFNCSSVILEISWALLHTSICVIFTTQFRRFRRVQEAQRRRQRQSVGRQAIAVRSRRRRGRSHLRRDADGDGQSKVHQRPAFGQSAV